MGINETKVVTANYRHDCPADCGQPIYPGDRIVHQDGGYVHETCHDPFIELLEQHEPRSKDPQLGLQPGEHACTTCWLVHAGECY